MMAPHDDARMVDVEMRMREGQARRLRQSARQKDLSLGAYVAAIHQAVLEAEALTQDGQQSPLGRVLEHTDFTARDVAENHDEYLDMAMEEEIQRWQSFRRPDNAETDEQTTE